MRKDKKILKRFFLLTDKTIIIIFLLPVTIFAQTGPNKVKPGIEVLLQEKTDLLSGRRVGLITNPTGVTSQLKTTIDVLYEHPDIKLVALFGPEHGVRGDVTAGQQIQSSTDEKTGLPVFSLYGSTKKPTPDMLKDIDILLFDIQDVGSRAYTYIYTMAYAMQAAAENNISFMVLDRPNPLGGELIEGPVLEPEFKSFIGLYEIPYIYGMTIGELARYFNKEFNIKVNLIVVPMQGWKRNMNYADTGLPWVPTSPHVPHVDTPFFIATTGCIGELQTINEGVGYTLPFELIGAEWIDSRILADELNNKKLPGVLFRPVYYKPYYFALQGKQLQGVQIYINDNKVYRPMLTQLHIIAAIYKLYPDQDIFNINRTNMFDKAMGTDKVRNAIKQGKQPNDIYDSFTTQLQQYRLIRDKYLHYD
ncbi:DUF1343 domain-containing protein [candidate division KSB1 bacterium]|nr:DUF1343 domain-containing protein [candidate division KSB1 bacterium]